jgi:hypothetical protein
MHLASQFVVKLACVLALTSASGCLSYTRALGYRSRQAVLRGDIDAFDELMEEAADSTPKGVFDNPKRTVLTHFLDFGGSDRFFPMIDKWKQKGWVNEFMTCAIHRARYRGVAEKDPVEADRAADVCLDEARKGAADPEKRWAIEACLDEAPFLTLDSTVALSRYIALASDVAEPFLFREGLIRGMTSTFLQDPGILRANDPTMPKDLAVRKAKAQLEEVTRRFESILGAVRPNTDATLVAGASAFGALEIERVNVGFQRSFVARYAESDLPEDSDLAWAWVRSIRARDRVKRLDPLGLYDPKREPPKDNYWYLCFERRPEGKQIILDAISVLMKESVNRESLREKECVDPKTNAMLPAIIGPYPLEVTARAAATSSVASALGADADVRVKLLRRAIPLTR